MNSSRPLRTCRRGESPIARLRLSDQICQWTEGVRPSIDNAQAIVDLVAAHVQDRPQEIAILVVLDHLMRAAGVVELAAGSDQSVEFNMRLVMEPSWRRATHRSSFSTRTQSPRTPFRLERITS